MPDAFLEIGNGYAGSVPIPVLVLLTGAVLTAIFINRTGRGLRIELLGANEVAARYSGLRNDRVLFVTYLVSACLASLAGIVIAARSASAIADYGASYVLLAIVIVVLAGVNPLGGFGTVTGVVLAAFTLQMVNTGLNRSASARSCTRSPPGGHPHRCAWPEHAQRALRLGGATRVVDQMAKTKTTPGRQPRARRRSAAERAAP